MESQQLALLGPVDWDLEREAHQLLCGELRRILAVDDGGDNVGRQQGKTQKPGDVTRRNALLALGRFCPHAAVRLGNGRLFRFVPTPRLRNQPHIWCRAWHCKIMPSAFIFPVQMRLFFEAYRELIEQVASDAYDAEGPVDDHGRILVTSEALARVTRSA
jgi:hypothetical protein